jgi:hypothetical protein
MIRSLKEGEVIVLDLCEVSQIIVSLFQFTLVVVADGKPESGINAPRIQEER